MSGIVLRAFVPADIPAVAAIEASVSPEPWSVGLFEGEFTVDPATRAWFVAEDDGAVVGFAGMMFVVDEGHVMNVAVAEDHRRRGIARALCDRLFAEAGVRNVRALTLEVRPDNAGAIALYRSYGFAPVGARRNYYTNADGSSSDALIMWSDDWSVAERGEALT